MTSYHPRSNARSVPSIADLHARVAREHLKTVLDLFCNHKGCYRWKERDSDHCPRHTTPDDIRKQQAEQEHEERMMRSEAFCSD